jgi:hypothetical protein
VTWTSNPDTPGGAEEPIHNVTVAVTAEGRPRFEVNGVSLEQRNYPRLALDATQRTQLLALWASFAGSKPFLFCDPAGSWLFVRFTAQPQIRTVYNPSTGASEYEAQVNLIQVPG